MFSLNILGFPEGAFTSGIGTWWSNVQVLRGCERARVLPFLFNKSYFSTDILGLSGDAHFDDDERFTTGTSDGINLDWVAVHEFGHSMGLEHSNVRESIMYPWYKGYFPNIELTEDDILGIQALYGKLKHF